jgi:hypothetical protein
MPMAMLCARQRRTCETSGTAKTLASHEAIGGEATMSRTRTVSTVLAFVGSLVAFGVGTASAEGAPVVIEPPIFFPQSEFPYERGYYRTDEGNYYHYDRDRSGWHYGRNHEEGLRYEHEHEREGRREHRR